MCTVTFLYNLHIYIKMAPQGVQQSHNFHQQADSNIRLPHGAVLRLSQKLLIKSASE